MVGQTFVMLIALWTATSSAAVAPLSDRVDAAQLRLIDTYADPSTAMDRSCLTITAADRATLPPAALAVLDAPVGPGPDARLVGQFHARAQQAIALAMANAVRDGDVADAQAWRAQLDLPRGVSANEGASILLNLPTEPAARADAARVLVREAITWQTARVRQLLAKATEDVSHADTPMPGRLMEELGEATTLAMLPPPLRAEAGIGESVDVSGQVQDLLTVQWPATAGPLATLRRQVETHLPSLLTPAERGRRERLLLKLVTLIPREYQNGVRDHQITVPLEYREAVAFSVQARQYADELTPQWLAENEAKYRGPIERLEQQFDAADAALSAKADPPVVSAILADTKSILTGDFGLSLGRSGTTADIVDEVMLETRSLLNQSLAAAMAGDWSGAENLRLEAYTSYDPELEARLMPRDPQLATDIERLLLDGLDQPGVKALLDKRADPKEIEAAYARVSDALNKATALLKSGVSPGAAAFNAGSIVLREGLEGLLVIVAILAGLRGPENRRKRHTIWYGVILSMVATGVTVVLSNTILTRLRSYGEVIEAVTSILAIGVLMLITNWLFQQVYWKQWVSSLKSQAGGDGVWQLITVGFLIGYREGFETTLFLQSLLLDTGGVPVVIGVSVGVLLLVALGIAALIGGMKLPYFQLLLLTAGMIGFVLVTFVGTGVRAMQTVGWLPVHKIIAASWPMWIGKWLGVYNSYETLGGQMLSVAIVIGTWRYSRWSGRRKVEKRRAEFAARPIAAAV